MNARKLATIRRVLHRREFRPVRKQLRQYINEEMDAKVRSLTSMTPNSEISEEDIFIIGHPKSGHTWFQNLAAGLMYAIDLELTPFPVVWDLVPDHNWPYYKRYGTPMFFKTHDFPKPKYRRVIYLLRDGRDVMVSYYRHMKAVRKQRGKKTSFKKIVNGRQGIYPDNKKWHEHVEAWLANPHQADMLIVRYENLKQNTIKELERVCEFVGIERDQSLLEDVAMKSTFQAMRKKEERHGLGKPMWGRDRPNRPKDKPFIRRGEIGSYRDEMPEEILEMFMKSASETMRKVGYLQS